MLDLLNNLLRTILLENVAGLQDGSATVIEDQVGFQPPGEAWRTHVSNLQRNALNVYLVELRENPKLRSNGRVRTLEAGMVYEEPAPAHLDCHYLISAQSPAEVSQQVEPAIDEHLLLYQAAAALFNQAPLNPGRVYPEGSAALLAWPERYRFHDLPTLLAPAEGFDKLPEFWTSMGAGSPWKPVFHLVVTLPVLFERQQAGALVTTRITEYRMTGLPETAEVWIQIGGRVLDGTTSPEAPLAGAWVRLETETGGPLKTTTTDSLGQFTFAGLHAGAYRLSWRASGFPEPAPRPIEVPSQSGEYDLRFI
jgi:hypothetical protein